MRCVWSVVGSIGLGACLVSCQQTSTDPAANLADGSRSYRIHRMALDELMASPTPMAPSAMDALQGLVYRPGYEPDLRLEGLEYLLELDRDATLTVLRRRLPRVRDHDWLRMLCQFVADHQLVELDEALVSSWGRPWSGGLREEERPEAIALSTMHGSDAPRKIVWEVFLAASKPSQSGMRYRCWDLLHRLGDREALIDIISSSEMSEAHHPLFVDLNAAAIAFGTVPWNREEILWMQKLSMPSRQAFWNAAAQATAKLTADQRASLEIRDLPVLTAVEAHRPEWFQTTSSELYEEVSQSLRGQRHYRETNPGFDPGVNLDHRLSAHRDRLTWGDLLALRIAQEALSTPAVRDHLFHYADRDHADESTEYGGVISLDERGRFEILEFPPRIRVHDRRFEASQEMFDAGYTGLFHFHFHAQKTRNGGHAGPGAGDMAYADSTRANCLVMTFVDEDTLNIDFYRHDGVLVDLGVIHRSSASMGS